MSALAAAVEASQDAAIKALGKRFVRSEDEPDPDLYRAQLHALGFLDDVGIGFMLTGWQILRQEKAAAPADTNGHAAVKVEPASEKQWSLLRKLCDEKGYPAPVVALSKSRASEAIDALQAGTYDPAKYDEPF